jgi:hypothetical protein
LSANFNFIVIGSAVARRTPEILSLRVSSKYSVKPLLHKVPKFWACKYKQFVFHDHLEGKTSAAGTKHDDEAREMSVDGKDWDDLPAGIGKVTGRLPAAALVVGRLSAVHGHYIDLWDYVEYPALQPAKFKRGASTVCAVPAQNGQAVGMQVHIREVVAIGQLAPPYARIVQGSVQ